MTQFGNSDLVAPWGVATDLAGNVFVSDNGPNGPAVLKYGP